MVYIVSFDEKTSFVYTSVVLFNETLMSFLVGCFFFFWFLFLGFFVVFFFFYNFRSFGEELRLLKTLVVPLIPLHRNQMVLMPHWY